MDVAYPDDLLAREAAPAYDSEGPFALWHVSEDPGLGTFRPHTPATNPASPPLVWAVDTRHLPLFWFRRDCPRACIWPVSSTTHDDRERFFGLTGTTRVHVIEASWLERMRSCRLYAYRLPNEAFRPQEVGGYWVSDDTVETVERSTLDDLITRHTEAGIELRVTPSIWPFWRSVVASTVEFSGLRLRNAAPHPEQVD